MPNKKEILAYEKLIYKYWPSFKEWKEWVNYQLLNRDQRGADPMVVDPNRKNGAVLLTLLLPLRIWEGKEEGYLDHIYVILEHRSKNLSNNPGDISFPGGKMDPEDSNPIDTALREAHEEVGLERENLHIVGLMDEFVSNSMMVVHPVVAWKVVDEDTLTFYDKMKKRYYPHTDETDEVYIVPLIHLINSDNYMSTNIVFTEAMRNVFIRFFSLDQYRIGTHVWGLTASILRRFIDIVFPGHKLPDESIQ